MAVEITARYEYRYDAWIPLNRLVITNPNLDSGRVESLTRGLMLGSIQPYELFPIYVRELHGKYYVNDGNHRVAALRRADITNKVFAEVYI